jgi:integrase
MQAAITNTFVQRLKPGAEPYEVRDTRLKGFFLRVQPSGHVSFYVSWGRGKRKSLGRADVLAAEQARIKAKQLLAKVYMGEDPLEEERAGKLAVTFAKFLTDRYAPWAEANLRTGVDTVKRLAQCFPDLLPKQLSAISAWDIEKWRSQSTKRGLKPSSVNRNLAIVRAALGKAVEWRLIPSHPLAGVKKAKEDAGASVRFLSDAELRRLHRALDEREERIRRDRDSANAWRAQRDYDLLPDLRAVPFADYLKPMVLVSLHTGVRRGELFSLTWERVDLDHAMLTVEAASAKSGRTRHVPLNAVALETLRGWRAQSGGEGLVFVSDGARFTNVRKAWGAVLRSAKIERFRWHDLRHHFASSLVMKGVDLATVRELMGHSDFALTLRYAHLQPEHRAAAVARLVGGA